MIVSFRLGKGCRDDTRNTRPASAKSSKVNVCVSFSADAFPGLAIGIDFFVETMRKKAWRLRCIPSNSGNNHQHQFKPSSQWRSADRPSRFFSELICIRRHPWLFDLDNVQPEAVLPTGLENRLSIDHRMAWNQSFALFFVFILFSSIGVGFLAVARSPVRSTMADYSQRRHRPVA